MLARIQILKESGLGEDPDMVIRFCKGRITTCAKLLGTSEEVFQENLVRAWPGFAGRIGGHSVAAQCQPRESMGCAARR